MNWLNQWLWLLGYAVVRIDEQEALKRKADRMDELDRMARVIDRGIGVRWIGNWDVN